MRRTPLVLTLVLVVSCDAPSTSVPEPGTALASPAGAEWTKDTVPLHRYLPEGMAGDFTPDTTFPFHIYWHNNGVHPRIRAAVRQAAARWGSIINPTEVLPYVFENAIECGYGGNALLRYAAGEMLAGGFHLYVSSDPAVDNPNRAWAVPPCISYGAYHPVTGAPPNGFTFIGERYAYNSYGESTALHEIGHLLGHGIGHRWAGGLETDYVIVDGVPRYFYVQTDSVAIHRYEEWLTRQGKKPYGLRKLPLFDYGHWHGCFLSEAHYAWPKQSTDVMTYNGRGTDRVITSVTASMLQGFKVDWDQFADTNPEVWHWTPDEQYWTECPQVRYILESTGLDREDTSDPSDTLHVKVPDPPDLGDDIRPWTYIRQGR